MTPKDNWKIDLKKTAFVTIDMQKAFLERGSPTCSEDGARLIPGINEIARLCRRAGVPVIHVYNAYRRDLAEIGLLNEIRPRTDSEWEVVEGRKGGDLASELDVQKSDYLVTKVRYSALIPGSSSLEPLLRGLGRDSFMICGIATDVCVGATTIDAMMLGFRVFFIGDLTSTFSAERQKVALEVINRHFAKVVTLAAVKTELEKLLPAAGK